MTITTPNPMTQVTMIPTPGQALPAIGSVISGLIVRSATETTVILGGPITPAEVSEVAAWQAARVPLVPPATPVAP